jgi:hypothetical protein
LLLRSLQCQAMNKRIALFQACVFVTIGLLCATASAHSPPSPCSSCPGHCCNNSCCYGECCPIIDGDSCCNTAGCIYCNNDTENCEYVCSPYVECCNGTCCDLGEKCCTDAGSYCCASYKTCCRGCCEDIQACANGSCVWGDIKVTHIKFNHSSGDAGDGITIKDVNVPEWTIYGHNKPAAYKKSTNVTIMAKFKVSPTSITSAKIRAITSDGILGNLGEQTVSFSNGVSNYVTFTPSSSTPASVNEGTISWQWKAKNLNGQTTSEYYINSSGWHKIYTVLDTPTAPMAEPWTEVLDKACIWASGEMSKSGAAGKVVDSIFSSGYQYDNVNGDARYYDPDDSKFKLTTCLSEWGISHNINCWDCSNMTCIFSNALGCGLNRYYITKNGGFYLNYIKPIGIERDWTNDPFTAPGRQGFALHWTGWSEIYDACLQVDDDSNPKSSPHTGKQPNNMTFNAGTPASYDDYRGKLVDPVDVNSVSGTSQSPSAVK